MSLRAALLCVSFLVMLTVANAVDDPKDAGQGQVRVLIKPRPDFWKSLWEKFLGMAADWDYYQDLEYFGLYHQDGFRSFAELDIDIANDGADVDETSPYGLSEKNMKRVKAITTIKEFLEKKKSEALDEFILALAHLESPDTGRRILNRELLDKLTRLATDDVKNALNDAITTCEGVEDVECQSPCKVKGELLFLASYTANTMVGGSLPNVIKQYYRILNKEFASRFKDKSGKTCNIVPKSKSGLKKDVLESPADEDKKGRYLETWSNFRSLLAFPSGEISRGDEATEAAEHLDVDGAKRRAWKAALEEKVEGAVGNTPGEKLFNAACTARGAAKPDWNVCREQLYLMKGFMTNSDMGTILDYRTRVTFSLLEATGAEAHKLAMDDSLQYQYETRRRWASDAYEMSRRVLRKLFETTLEKGDVATILESLEPHKAKIAALSIDPFKAITQPDYPPFDSQLVTPAPRVTFPNMGSMSPTSDIDIPVTGLYSEHVVQSFYDKFRNRFGVESSTAMDVNAYGVASDLVIKTAEKRMLSRDVGTPIWSLSDLKMNARAQRELTQLYYENGDIASMLGVRRVIHDRDNWGSFVDKIKKRMAGLMLTKKATLGCDEGGFALVGEFHRRMGKLLSTYTKLQNQLDARAKAICPDAGDHPPNDCINRAMNELYSEKINDMLPQRVIFEQFVDTELMTVDVDAVDFDVEKAMDLVLRADRLAVVLSTGFTEAGFFGNEAYVGAGGAILHVVGNMQGGRGIMMTADNALQSINENYGMLLHAFHHFGGAEPAGLKLGRSLFQTGKYLIRIVHAFDYIQNAARDQIVLEDKIRELLDAVKLLGSSLDKVKKMDLDNEDGEASVLVIKTSYCLKLLGEFLAKVHEGSLIDHMDQGHEKVRGKNPEEVTMEVYLSIVAAFVAELNAVSRVAGIGVPVLPLETALAFGPDPLKFKTLADVRFANIFYGKDELSKGVDEDAVSSLRQRILRRIHKECKARDDGCKELLDEKKTKRGSASEKSAFLTETDKISLADAPQCLKEEDRMQSKRSTYIMMAGTADAFRQAREEGKGTTKEYDECTEGWGDYMRNAPRHIRNSMELGERTGVLLRSNHAAKHASN